MLHDFQQFDNESQATTTNLEMHEVAMGTHLSMAPEFVQGDLMLSVANISLQQGSRLMLGHIH